MPDRLARLVDWWFRDRRTGSIVVGQFPNAPLWVWIAATAVRVVASPSGTAATALSVVGGLGLAVWAVLELGWGVNPWRRLLGAVVLVGQLAGLAG